MDQDKIDKALDRKVSMRAGGFIIHYRGLIPSSQVINNKTVLEEVNDVAVIMKNTKVQNPRRSTRKNAPIIAHKSALT